jgi:5'-nucleotidase
MKVKRILLTGDDGYNSVGTRILVHILKNKYDLRIAATRDQMSGVGGHISIKNGGRWGETSVDGVPAFWVDGYPADAIECIVGYFRNKFDLVISGINLGMNIGGAVVLSGTYSAAIHALNLKLADRAMALSWNCPPEFWYGKHNGDEDITRYLEYPGAAAAKIIELSIKQDLWRTDLLNINFPSHASNLVRFTKGLPDLKRFFRYPINLDRKTRRFSYPKGEHLNEETKGELEIDTGAMLSGFISISPHNIHNLNESVFNKLKKTEIKI